MENLLFLGVPILKHIRVGNLQNLCHGSLTRKETPKSVQSYNVYNQTPW